MRDAIQVSLDECESELAEAQEQQEEARVNDLRLEILNLKELLMEVAA